jgi:hypothetical protein
VDHLACDSFYEQYNYFKAMASYLAMLEYKDVSFGKAAYCAWCMVNYGNLSPEDKRWCDENCRVPAPEPEPKPDPEKPEPPVFEPPKKKCCIVTSRTQREISSGSCAPPTGLTDKHDWIHLCTYTVRAIDYPEFAWVDCEPGIEEVLGATVTLATSCNCPPLNGSPDESMQYGWGEIQVSVACSGDTISQIRQQLPKLPTCPCPKWYYLY